MALPLRLTNQRLVKTTPKPRATKNSSGELVGPLPPPPEDVVVAGGATADAVAVDITTRDVPYVVATIYSIGRNWCCEVSGRPDA